MLCYPTGSRRLPQQCALFSEYIFEIIHSQRKYLSAIQCALDIFFFEVLMKDTSYGVSSVSANSGRSVTTVMFVLCDYRVIHGRDILKVCLNICNGVMEGNPIPTSPVLAIGSI